MRRFAAVACGRRAGAASRQASRTTRLLLPSLIFPLFFFIAFAGGLSNVGNVPGFDFPSGYTAFQFVFVLLQAARSAACSPASGSRPTSRTASRAG